MEKLNRKLGLLQLIRRHKTSAIFVIVSASLIYYDYSLTQKGKQNKAKSQN